MLCLKCQFDNLAEMYIIPFFTNLNICFFLIKKNPYPWPYIHVYTETSYQSPEMLIWQTSCTRKEVFCKMTCWVKLNKDKGRVKKKCLTSTLDICLYRDFISITRNADFADNLHSERGVTQNDIKREIQISQIKILFLILGFQKHIVSNRLYKIH